MYEVSSGNIWEFAQNKPSLVADDLEIHFGIPREETLKVLMARGVFKWLAVRRDLIRLKDEWKVQIRETITEIHEAKKNGDFRKALILKGRIRILVKCREEVRKLCHSERWRFPDNDSRCREF